VAPGHLVDTGRVVAMPAVEDETTVAVGAVHRPVDPEVEVDPRMAEGAADAVAGHPVGVDADDLRRRAGGWRGGGGRSGLAGHWGSPSPGALGGGPGRL